MYADTFFLMLGVIFVAVVCTCICCCTNLKASSPSDQLPQTPAGPVYFYDMTQVTPPNDSAPPPYHLATLYPPVNCHQQMNPPVYQEATRISVDSPMYYPVNTNLRLT